MFDNVNIYFSSTFPCFQNSFLHRLFNVYLFFEIQSSNGFRFSNFRHLLLSCFKKFDVQMFFDVQTFFDVKMFFDVQIFFDVKMFFDVYMWVLLIQLIRPPRTMPAPPMMAPTTTHCLLLKNPDPVFSDFDFSEEVLLSTSRPSIRFDIRSSTIRFFFRRSVNLFRAKINKFLKTIQQFNLD